MTDISIAERLRKRTRAAQDRQALERDKAVHEAVGQVLEECEKAADQAKKSAMYSLPEALTSHDPVDVCEGTVSRLRKMGLEAIYDRHGVGCHKIVVRW